MAAIPTTAPGVTVRPLSDADLDEADRIFRVAFGTFLGLPDPTTFFETADYVHTRFATRPDAAFAAELDGELAGTNFATRWGSVGVFGPLTVRPHLWDRGIGSRLMEPIMETFADWGVRHAGLFTFAHSEKHVGLYQKFGFWPRFLTPIMAKPAAPGDGYGSLRLSRLAPADRDARLAACAELTDSLYEGLDLSAEILAVERLGLGDTVLLEDGDGLAVCHCGPRTEAGAGACYVKFGAVSPGPGAEARFHRLLDACDAFATENGLEQVVAGTNLARHEAYRAMLDRGYRTWLQGVTMHRPNDAGYSRPDVFAIDDWR